MDKSNPLAPVKFNVAAEFAAPAANEGTRRFSGTAYSGDVVTDHGYYDAVVIDLATTKVVSPMPVLLNHDHPVGVGKAKIGDGISIDGQLFADVDPNAKSIAEMADRGMPWQMSVHVKPGAVEQVKAGATVNVNGRKFKGPITVLRQNRIRETSFCALGADHQTEAHVFTGGNAADPHEEPMDTVSKEEHDRVVAELRAQIQTANTATETEKARADGLAAQFALQAKQRRTDDVKQLFSDCGREFKDEFAKPYLDMADEAFSAVAKDLRASAKQRDPKLFREQATQGNGNDPTNLDTVEKITAKAEQFMAEQSKAGKTVSVADAVAFVTKKAA